MAYNNIFVGRDKAGILVTVTITIVHSSNIKPDSLFTPVCVLCPSKFRISFIHKATPTTSVFYQQR
jgi:hypothetical protein